MADTRFKKGLVPWNKGKKGVYTQEQLKRMSESRKGKHQSKEHGKKISDALKGRIPKNLNSIKGWNKGILMSEESRKKLSESHKGIPAWNKGISPSEESRKKMSITHKARPSKYQFKKGNIPWIKGKHQSEEWKRRIGVANLGKRRTDEEKRKIGEAWKKTFLNNPDMKRKMSESHRGHHPSEGTRLKMKDNRAKQIFPVKDSLPERKIQNFLRQLNIEFIPHKYMKIEHRYCCDIFVSSINLVIEADGDYWHGNKSNPRYKILNKHQIIQREEDNLRTKELQEKGFHVSRLWESDIEKMNLNDFIEKIKPFQKI